MSAVGLEKPRLGKPKPVKKKKKNKTVNRKSTIEKLRKEAHALMREIVLSRDNGCVCPPTQGGHTSIRQAGHIVEATNPGCRWSLWNVHEQCKACNGRHAMKGRWNVYQEWFERKFGSEKWLAILDEKNSRNYGLKRYELEELIVQLKLIRSRQKSEPEWLPYFSQSEILSGAWSK